MSIKTHLSVSCRTDVLLMNTKVVVELEGIFFFFEFKIIILQANPGDHQHGKYE